MPLNTPIRTRATLQDFITQIEILSKLVAKAEPDPSYLNRHDPTIPNCNGQWAVHHIGDNIQGLQNSLWHLEEDERITAHLALNALQVYFLRTVAESRMYHASK